jgi:DHA2 family lincomycin resistance protein-like MFS transporter
MRCRCSRSARRSALAPGFDVLFAGRTVQAVGTAVFLPLLMTTAMRLVPAARRGHMMALVTAVPAGHRRSGPRCPVSCCPSGAGGGCSSSAPDRRGGPGPGRGETEELHHHPEPVTLDVLSLVLSAVRFGALVYGLASIGESVSGHALACTERTSRDATCCVLQDGSSAPSRCRSSYKPPPARSSADLLGASL